MGSRIQILDATLREGEQHPGVRFTAEDKIQMVHLLEKFPVDIIEVGHPGISAEDEEVCRKVARAASRCPILMHARANIDEVRAAKRAGADWVGIWASVNDVAWQTKFVGHDLAYVLRKIHDAITEAKNLGLKVRFTVEDASRTSWDRVKTAAQTALTAGADRVSLADTAGIWEPRTCKEMVTRAVEELQCQIEVHLHNDLGLALANALTAIDAGASVIDASIMGLGERTGITDLIQLSVALHTLRGEQRFELGMIPELVRAASLATGFRPDGLRPVVGRHAFTHTSAYHVQAVQRNPKAYEAYEPEWVGRTRKIQQGRPPLGHPKLPFTLLVGRPFSKGASELQYHRDGPGVRWVLMDGRVDPRASFYVIQRRFNSVTGSQKVEKHVDLHAHDCDSAFLFWGDQPDGTGLLCHVRVGNQEQLVESPASIFVPAGIEHTYHYVSGCGTYINIVLEPDYNNSLV